MCPKEYWPWGTHIMRARGAGDGLGGACINVLLQVRRVLGMHARKKLLRRAAADGRHHIAVPAASHANAQPWPACVKFCRGCVSV